jgi:hypothetical protein
MAIATLLTGESCRWEEFAASGTRNEPPDVTQSDGEGRVQDPDLDALAARDAMPSEASTANIQPGEDGAIACIQDFAKGIFEERCNGVCVNTQTDIDNCGACGLPCGIVAPEEPACADGHCLLPMATRFEDAASPPTRRAHSAYPQAVVREEHTLTIGGVSERWRLEWERPPTPTCIDEATCYCADFTYGEKGYLDVVRERPGEPEDRLHLSPFIGEEVEDGHGRSHVGQALLMRWPPMGSDGPHPPTLTELQDRRSASVMQFADYDNDGRATEFKVLTWNIAPCTLGRLSIVVGIDRRNPRLHVFTADGSPLVLRKEAWESVRQHVPITVINIACGNHGSIEEDTSVIWRDGRGFHRKDQERACNFEKRQH